MIIRGSQPYFPSSSSSNHAKNASKFMQSHKCDQKIENFNRENSFGVCQKLPFNNYQSKSNQNDSSNILFQFKQSKSYINAQISRQVDRSDQIKLQDINQPQFLSIIQSQPANLYNSQPFQKEKLQINYSDNRYNKKNDRNVQKNIQGRLFPTIIRQAEPRNKKSKNPLKRFFSCCFGGRPSRQNVETIQNRDNVYEITDSNGCVVSFNYQSSNMLGSFLGVVAIMDSIDRPKKKIAGIQQQQFKKFQTFIFNEQKDEKSCIICCNEYKNAQKILRLPCNHDYHQKSIQKWLNQSPLCPICKRNLKKQPQK